MITPDEPQRLTAHERLKALVLQRLTADYAPADDPHRGDTIDYLDEQIELAARDLTDAVEASPRNTQPIGWTSP